MGRGVGDDASRRMVVTAGQLAEGGAELWRADNLDLGIEPADRAASPRQVRDPRTSRQRSGPTASTTPSRV